MLAKLGFLLSKGQEISAGKDFWRVLVRCDRSALQLPVFHKPEFQKVDHSIANGMDRITEVTRQGMQGMLSTTRITGGGDVAFTTGLLVHH